jgi:hypothetical protein
MFCALCCHEARRITKIAGKRKINSKKMMINYVDEFLVGKKDIQVMKKKIKKIMKLSEANKQKKKKDIIITEKNTEVKQEQV